MAEKHYVDPKGQHIAAEGVPTHSELTTMYRNAHKEELGRWMQEDERQAVMEKERNTVTTNLRKSSVLVGICISLPVVLGILIGQLGMTRVGINQADAMALSFLLLFLTAGLLLLTYALFKWVEQTFHDHTLKALPISLTVLGSLFFLIRPTFLLTGLHIGGLAGYGVGLLLLLILGIVITTITIFFWTAPKIHPLIKIFVLLLFFGGAVAAAYLV